MKGFRTWNRRDFSVTANGYFNVLKPTGWFATVRLPGRFRYRFGQSKGAESPRAHENPTEYLTAAPSPGAASASGQNGLDQDASEQTLSRLQILPPSSKVHGLMGPMLIALAATLITVIFLWALRTP
jgi:hypothetical protein